MTCITSFTPTLCRVLNVAPPTLSAAETLAGVVRIAAAAFDCAPAEKCLLYAPDAIGLDLYREHTALFEPAREHAPFEVPLRAVYPSKTPVCFASMFTGALPEAHGIRRYEKPVLRCDTLFDALIRAGMRVAIVAVEGSSVDLVFRGREMDYFSEKYDREVTSRAVELLAAAGHDVIVAYHQEYDDALHDTTPRSARALRALKNHVESFATLSKAAARFWRRFNHFIAFTPDHGAHVDVDTGRGTHGDDVDDDMNVMHLYGVAPGNV